MIHAWRTALWGALFFEAGALIPLMAKIGSAWVTVFMIGCALFMLLTRERHIVFAVLLLALPLAGFVALWAMCRGASC